jgi:hypothetical protein
MSSNMGQQVRLVAKLQRNLGQVFTSVDGVVATFASNGSDQVLSIDGGATKKALVKVKEITIGNFPNVGVLQHIIGVCVDTDVDVGFLTEVMCRVHELHCGIEMYQTDGADPLVQDDVAGMFLSAHTSLKRAVRAQVDAINIGQ